MSYVRDWLAKLDGLDELYRRGANTELMRLIADTAPSDRRADWLLAMPARDLAVVNALAQWAEVTQ